MGLGGFCIHLVLVAAVGLLRKAADGAIEVSLISFDVPIFQAQGLEDLTAFSEPLQAVKLLGLAEERFFGWSAK